MRVIYGRRPVREVLDGQGPVQRLLYAADPAPELRALVDQAVARGVTAQRVDRGTLDRAADGGHHQGIVAELPDRQPATLDDAMALAAARQERALLLVLDHLQDPQNFGTLLRTAEAAGVHGVIFPSHRGAQVSGGVVRASAGAIEHLLVIEQTNIVAAIERLQRAGVWVVGLDERAEQPYWEIDPDVPLAIVVGAEGAGLSRLTKKRCDYLVSLPLAGRVASLNAAVAGSIVIYDVWRRRMATPPGRPAGA